MESISSAVVPSAPAPAAAGEPAAELDEAAMNDLRNPDIQQKYRTAAEIANDAIKMVIGSLVPGRRIAELCEIGDALIVERTSKVYNKGKIEKGIAFPTCISVNNLAGHVSPLSDAPEAIAVGDVVKVDLAVHVDGYIAAVAQTAVVTGNADVACTGRAADVVCAAYTGAEVAVRLVREGRKNTEITEALAKVATAFKCKPLEGVLSHSMKRYLIDGPRVVIGNADHENNVDEIEFAPGDVFAIDVVMSTGDGKTRESDTRTTVFKRNVDTSYSLKMKASRFLFSELNRRFPTLPFSLRALDEDKRGRLGITEIVTHQLVTPFPVLAEKSGEIVAQFKFTVLVTATGTQRITAVTPPFAKSELAVTDADLLALLAGPATAAPKKAKRNKKSKGAAKGAAADESDGEDEAPAATAPAAAT